MSETDDDYHDNGYPVVASLGGDDKDMPQNKKRKIQRACDVCRRKKVSKSLGLSHPTPYGSTRRPSARRPSPAPALGGHPSTAALRDPISHLRTGVAACAGLVVGRATSAISP